MLPELGLSALVFTPWLAVWWSPSPGICLSSYRVSHVRPGADIRLSIPGPNPVFAGEGGLRGSQGVV